MRARPLLRLLVSGALVAFSAADLYVWLARPPDPPLVGLYAAVGTLPGFWVAFHSALVLLLLAGLAEGLLSGRDLLRDAARPGPRPRRG